MVWRRFCHFVPFFAEKLSEKLYDAKANVVKASRIRFINATELCKGKGNNAEAILDFFVSKSENDLGTGDVDRNITILAYIKMRDYWKNKKMALLDPVFIGQVTSNLLAITLLAAHTVFIFRTALYGIAKKKKREKKKNRHKEALLGCIHTDFGYSTYHFDRQKVLRSWEKTSQTSQKIFQNQQE